MKTDLFGNASTLDTGERSSFDFYPTPGFMTRSLVYHVQEIGGSLVLECASGDDAIVEVLRDEFGCRVWTNDLDPTQPAQFHLDATFPDLFVMLARMGHPPEWIISNPPFNVAFEMLQQAVTFAGVGVAFLLRKTFLEPTEERGEWLANNPPSRIICQPRHKFRAGSEHSDSVSCDWMVWERTPVRNVFPIEIDHKAKERGKVSV